MPQEEKVIFANNSRILGSAPSPTGSVGHFYLTTYTAALKGRTVLILPDADDAGREGAERTLPLLRPPGAEAQVRDLFPHREDHTDFADYLMIQLREKSSQASGAGVFVTRLPLARPFPHAEGERIERMFSRQPLLWQLADEFGLEISKCASAPET